MKESWISPGRTNPLYRQRLPYLIGKGTRNCSSTKLESNQNRSLAFLGALTLLERKGNTEVNKFKHMYISYLFLSYRFYLLCTVSVSFASHIDSLPPQGFFTITLWGNSSWKTVTGPMLCSDGSGWLDIWIQVFWILVQHSNEVQAKTEHGKYVGITAVMQLFPLWSKQTKPCSYLSCGNLFPKIEGKSSFWSC